MAAASSPRKPPPPLLLLLLLLLLSSFVPAVVPDLTAQKAALLELRNAVGGRTYQWNDATAPCSWKGIRCQKGNVTSLRLPGFGLMGPIPLGVFGNLTGLRKVSLRSNFLHGALPSDLAACTELRALYLQNNEFSGSISVVLPLKLLIRLHLASNAFSGEIPPGITGLTRLAALYLQINDFTGRLPHLGKLENLRDFNVSYNNLSGPIPNSPIPGGWRKDSFLGMPSLCGPPLRDCPRTRAGKKLSAGAIAGIVIAGVVALILLILVLCWCCFRKSGRTDVPKDVTNDVGPPDVVGNRGETASTPSAVPGASSDTTRSKTSVRGRKLVFFGRRDVTFLMEDLLRASAEVLGKGTFGMAYKASLHEGTTVAVKRLKDVDLAEAKFKEKIEAVGKMDHPNLVPLRAYYYSKDEKLLVYDFVPLGSLSALLHGHRGSSRIPLDWLTRLSIAVGAARGTQYIHSIGPEVSHGNIKSSNILLAKFDYARVSDQGLSQLAPPSLTTNRIAGYRAPEVTDPRKVSQKADVYSFGVLLLELLTGKAPAQAMLNDDGVDLPRWVHRIVSTGWTTEVFDLELLRYNGVEDEMGQLLQLALDCSSQFPVIRPTMSEVVARIEAIQRASLDPDEVEPQKPDVADAPPPPGPPTHMD